LGEGAGVASKIAMTLELLGDGKWHRIEEMRQQMNLSFCEVEEITSFLDKYGFAEVDGSNERVRVNRDFRKILAQNAF
jgi:DNA-binding IclR family transcriptional regulator